VPTTSVTPGCNSLVCAPGGAKFAKFIVSGQLVRG
jgi:hypothetical protein